MFIAGDYPKRGARATRIPAAAWGSPRAARRTARPLAPADTGRCDRLRRLRERREAIQGSAALAKIALARTAAPRAS
ncbi:hypothetical protein MKK75_32840 [Methylobacterium sp. J-030]|uniref:hypothetical protein n=1 Tax=Methylobacterium sp. J-030 TaxID=2836627 RepID=UPI001FB880FC|nr:hypothetical protein [Methylobacterium sp. J-030]MCJ2073521.1 hypothetical protein [Methylobacterium sp. J-030]